MKIELIVSDYDESSIEEKIINTTIQRLFEATTPHIEKTLRLVLRDELEAKARNIIEEQLAKLITDGIPTTDNYGNATGKVETIQSIFLKRLSTRDWNRSFEQSVEKLIKEELSSEIVAIRKEIREKWSGKLLALITEEAKRFVNQLPVKDK